jgi:hypothetical protein
VASGQITADVAPSITALSPPGGWALPLVIHQPGAPGQRRHRLAMALAARCAVRVVQVGRLGLGGRGLVAGADPA